MSNIVTTRKPSPDQVKAKALIQFQHFNWDFERMVGRTLRLYKQVKLLTGKELQFLVAEVDGYGNVKWGDRVL